MTNTMRLVIDELEENPLTAYGTISNHFDELKDSEKLTILLECMYTMAIEIPRDKRADVWSRTAKACEALMNVLDDNENKQ